MIANERTLGFGANINRGVAATSAPYVIASNSDIEVTPGAVAELTRLRRGASALRDRRPAAALPGRPLAAFAPQLPDRPRHARPPHAPAPRCCTPSSGSATTTCWTSGPSSRRSPTGSSARSCSCAARCWSELGGLDEGYRLYGEDIDLAYRARKAGWERWYVPSAVVVHHHQAVTDRRFFTRRTLWHWRSIARFVRKHPESLRAL